MFGAIAGDVIGSTYEWHNVKNIEFELFSRESRFTDDTVMTIAVAEAILNKRKFKNPFKDNAHSKEAYAYALKAYGKRHPNAGYGNMFNEWLSAKSIKPYNSFGNGSAMRVSPVGFAFNSIEEVLKEAKRSAMVTHNHKQGIRGAQSIAGAVYFARIGKDKSFIKNFIQHNFKYNLEFTLDEIREGYAFDSSCQGSVPQAIVAFLESEDYEDAIRKAISIGGDSDTIACMTGGIAQAYYRKIPKIIVDQVMLRLDSGFKEVIRQFNSKYDIQY
ncbi:MAG: ADP-ribosylglycohydrolase family protein [Bacillota bacterium]|nr:ADP-ribosylglycohydrolase family protein [Bacillota bacterium]